MVIGSTIFFTIKRIHKNVIINAYDSIKASILCNVEHNKHAKRYSDQQLIIERTSLQGTQAVVLCGQCAQATFLSRENWLLHLILRWTYLCPIMKNTQTKKLIGLYLVLILLLLLGWPRPPAQKHCGVCRVPVPISAASGTWEGTGAQPPSENTFLKWGI